MKKPLLCEYLLAGGLAVSAAVAFGQGTVVFQNDDRGLVYQWVGLTNPTVVPLGYDGRPHIQIAYAPGGTEFTPMPLWPLWTTERWIEHNPGWTLGPTAIMTGKSFGLFDGGTISLQGVAPGSEAEYAIFAWGPGATYDEAATYGQWYGFAGPFTTLTGGDGQPPVSLADSFTGVTIVGSLLVPEPSSLALAILGAVGLVLRRTPRRIPPTGGASRAPSLDTSPGGSRACR